jgi:hypothetical protein
VPATRCATIEQQGAGPARTQDLPCLEVEQMAMIARKRLTAQLAALVGLGARPGRPLREPP